MDTTLTPDPAWRVALRPLITARGWTSLTHHLLGLPLGTAYFIWLVTGLSTGLGLAITIVGIPLLTLVLAATRPLLMLERGLANALLGTQLPPVAVAPQGEGWFGRLKAYWTDGTTWRGVGYLLARFPIGVATFTIAVVTYSVALWCLAAPLLAPLEADGPRLLGAELACSRASPSCPSASWACSPPAGSPRAWRRCRAA